MGCLRFLFALAVVIAHSAPIFGFTLIPGDLAVQSFYMISGFYISLVLNEKYVGVNKSYKLFLSNRMLRLYPVYWVVLFITVLYSIIFTVFFNSSPDTGISMAYYRQYLPYMSIPTIIYFVFTNLFILGQELVFAFTVDWSTGALTLAYQKYFHPALFNFIFVPQAWTVSIELMFYICAPFLVRRKSLFVIGLILCSLLIRIALYNLVPELIHFFSYRFFPTELALFLSGTLAYKLLCFWKKRNLSKNLKVTVFIIMLGFTFVYPYLSFQCLYIVFIALFFLALPIIFLLTKNNKIDRKIGELSYPLYICHLFVLIFINSLSLRLEASLWALNISVFSIILAFILYKFVDIPLNNYRQKRLKK